MEPPAPTESPTDEPTEAPQPTEPPASADGETLLQDRCTACHGLERITRASKTGEEWGVTVDRMIGNGAELNAEERDVLIDYLTEMYGAE
jgi:cytochrome c5